MNRAASSAPVRFGSGGRTQPKHTILSSERHSASSCYRTGREPTEQVRTQLRRSDLLCERTARNLQDRRHMVATVHAPHPDVAKAGIGLN